MVDFSAVKDSLTAAWVDGFTIESVDGVTADWAVDSAYWALYEGEEYATTSAAGIALVDGGVYKLVYEAF